jgi:HAD superfamily hydrolase (TIGR01509 family)
LGGVGELPPPDPSQFRSDIFKQTPPVMKTILVDAVDGLIIKTENGFQLFTEMYDLLESFPNRKIILTGANDEQFKIFGLNNAPYEVFTLKHNPEKTDPKYFELMLQHFNLSKDDVVYFEHNPEAVKSAESIGIKSYYYDPVRKDLISLKEFLLINSARNSDAPSKSLI